MVRHSCFTTSQKVGSNHMVRIAGVLTAFASSSHIHRFSLNKRRAKQEEEKPGSFAMAKLAPSAESPFMSPSSFSNFGQPLATPTIIVHELRAPISRSVTDSFATLVHSVVQ